MCPRERKERLRRGMWSQRVYREGCAEERGINGRECGEGSG